MEKILLFTNMSSIQKHWERALEKSYETVCFESFDALLEELKRQNKKTIVMVDEMSISNIEDALQKFKEYPYALVLLFHALPEVYHASTLLGSGIKGYENAYINKENLLQMLQAVEDGNNWLFADLTYFIINKFMQTNKKNEPEFMPRLTEKERDIALMITEGLSNKEIAQREKIALSTVKGHIHHIFEKAGVTDRISLVLKFR